MPQNKNDPDDDGVTPRWDGNPGQWDDYVLRAQAFYWGTKPNEREVCGPRLFGRLTGKAWRAMRKYKPEVFAKENGVDKLIEALHRRIGNLPIPDAGEKMNAFF